MFLSTQGKLGYFGYQNKHHIMTTLAAVKLRPGKKNPGFNIDLTQVALNLVREASCEVFRLLSSIVKGVMQPTK